MKEEEIKKIKEKARKNWIKYLYSEDAGMFNFDIDSERFVGWLESIIEESYEQGKKIGNKNL